ncbi:hypothetical protein NL676_014917 [Syzygium grande]|nr:hypothetical protein NL676_014917 [Syzygium grande]
MPLLRGENAGKPTRGARRADGIVFPAAAAASWNLFAYRSSYFLRAGRWSWYYCPSYPSLPSSGAGNQRGSALRRAECVAAHGSRIRWYFRTDTQYSLFLRSSRHVQPWRALEMSMHGWAEQTWTSGDVKVGTAQHEWDFEEGDGARREEKDNVALTDAHGGKAAGEELNGAPELAEGDMEAGGGVDEGHGVAMGIGGDERCDVEVGAGGRRMSCA